MSDSSITAVLKAFSEQLPEATIKAATLEALRVEFLGKNGHISMLMRQLPTLPEETRKDFGAQVNAARAQIEQLLQSARHKLETQELELKLQTEKIDVTLPTRGRCMGSLHPVTTTIHEIQQIFSHMEFGMAEGPEIEDDWHNFTALNIGEMHPARQMHDTFYCTINTDHNTPGLQRLLRTHTSTVQIRHMSEQQPPLRIITAGRVYRSDYDATHTPMFHQIEGLCIDRHISMAHLKGCLEKFLELFFGTKVELRLRPSYFPFTEPSAEVDIRCDRSNTKQIKIGAGQQWLEVMGCGLVHPNVLRNVGIDPSCYQGFAFGLGVERMAMLKHGIPDLRQMYDGDVRRMS